MCKADGTGFQRDRECVLSAHFSPKRRELRAHSIPHPGAVPLVKAKEVLLRNASNLLPSQGHIPTLLRSVFFGLVPQRFHPSTLRDLGSIALVQQLPLKQMGGRVKPIGLTA